MVARPGATARRGHRLRARVSRGDSLPSLVAVIFHTRAWLVLLHGTLNQLLFQATILLFSSYDHYVNGELTNRDS